MNERQRILKLLEEKKITADEASRLLDALGDEGGQDVLEVLGFQFHLQALVQGAAEVEPRRHRNEVGIAECQRARPLIQGHIQEA